MGGRLNRWLVGRNAEGRSIKIRVMAAAVAALAVSPAYAWNATVEGPDVFGVTRVLAGEPGLQTNIVIQCQSSGELFFAQIYPKKAFEDVSEMPAVLHIAVSDAPALKIAAKHRTWNDNFAGVVSSVEAAELAPVLKAIRDAKGKILVGAELGGNRISDSFSSSGSTAAMAKVIKECKLPVD